MGNCRQLKTGQDVRIVGSPTAAPPGWFAVFRNDDGTEFHSPVAVFVTVVGEDDPVDERPDPFISTVSDSPADNWAPPDCTADNFVGFTYRPDWLERTIG